MYSYQNDNYSVCDTDQYAIRKVHLFQIYGNPVLANQIQFIKKKRLGAFEHRIQVRPAEPDDGRSSMGAREGILGEPQLVYDALALLL